MRTDKPFSTIFTYTRASPAYDFDALGNLTSAASGAIRYGADASGVQGWILEDAVTNLATNPWAVGGGVTVPTAWTIGGLNAGITGNPVGTTTINGLTCQLIRFQGVMSGSGSVCNMQFGTGLAVTAASGATWSVWASVFAGTLNGITAHNLRIASASTATQAVTVDGTFSRKAKTFAFASDTTAAPQLVPSANAGATIDITYAFAAPNLTAGAVLYNPMFPTAGTVAASTKAIDSLSITGTTFAPGIFGIGAPQGFVTMDVLLPALPGGSPPRPFMLSDGTINNGLEIFIQSNGATSGQVTLAGATASTGNAGTITPGVATRIGLRWGAGVMSVCKDGGTIVNLATAIPATNALQLGNRVALDRALNGRIRNIRAGSFAPTDAKFQAACVYGADVTTTTAS